MPNIGAVLKDEVARLSRKELRRETSSLKKASGQYRRDVAALKRHVATLLRKVALLEQNVLAKPPELPADQKSANVRFTTKGLVSLRKRLGLSAAEFGALTNVTPTAVYNWERGTSRPRKAQVVKMAALRGIGKREAKARIAQLVKPNKRAAKTDAAKTDAAKTDAAKTDAAN